MTTDAAGLRARLAAGAAMVMCCGLVIAVALGLVAVSGAWMLVGVGVAAIAACLGVVGWFVSRLGRPLWGASGVDSTTSAAGNAEGGLQATEQPDANARPPDLPAEWKE